MVLRWRNNLGEALALVSHEPLIQAASDIAKLRGRKAAAAFPFANRLPRSYAQRGMAVHRPMLNKQRSLDEQ